MMSKFTKIMAKWWPKTLQNAPQSAPNDASMPPRRPQDDQKRHPSQHNTFLMTFWRHRGRPGSDKMTLKTKKKRFKIIMQNCLRQNQIFRWFLMISVPKITSESTPFSMVRFRKNHCFCLVKPMFFTICHHLKSMQKKHTKKHAKNHSKTPIGSDLGLQSRPEKRPEGAQIRF